MKNYLYFGAFLFSLSAFAQIDVPEVQKSLYGSVDATWCGNCGNVGLPTTASIYSQVNDKAVFFELHASSQSALYAPTAESLSDEFGVSSYPSVTLNGELKGPLSGSIENQLINDINTNYNGTSTQVNAGFEWSVEGDSLVVNTNTKFFEELTGDFYTGVYISQDSIWEFQANYNPNIPNGNIYHFHILRDVLSENVHGVLTGSGTIAADTEIMKTHKIKIDPSWNLNHIHINTIVWEKNGNNYAFKNANNVGTVLTPNLSVDQFNQTAQVSLFPNPSTNFIQVESKEQNLTQLQIVDRLGRTLRVIQADGQKNTFIDVSNLASGMYYLVGQTENQGAFNHPFIKK